MEEGGGAQNNQSDEAGEHTIKHRGTRKKLPNHNETPPNTKEETDITEQQPEGANLGKSRLRRQVDGGQDRVGEEGDGLLELQPAQAAPIFGRVPKRKKITIM